MTRTIVALPFYALLLVSPVSMAAACPLEPGWKPPPLEEWLAHSPIAFIGTVISSGWPEEKLVVGSPPREIMFGRRNGESPFARFRVDVHLRGINAPLAEVRQGRTVCDNEFQPGERWLFVGTRNGSFVFGGSRIMRTAVGKEYPLAAEDRDTLRRVFPDAELD
jgi:hypothetical protein